MADDLTFMMGKFEARFPTDRQYAKNHMWASATDDGFRFGFAAYAVRLLQDVYFLDWEFDPPIELAEKQQIGAVESSKAESDLFAPMAGRLTALNAQLLSDPSAINVDKYGAGWLFEMSGVGGELLSAEKYIAHLAAIWEVTQRTIKGQFQ